MSTRFLISDFDTQILEVDTQILAERLQRDWSPLEIRDETILVSDSLEWDCDGITGTVSDDKTDVEISGGLPVIAKFTIWFRQQVPSEIPLSILENHYEHGQLKLDENTTPKDVFDFFS